MGRRRRILEVCAGLALVLGGPRASAGGLSHHASVDPGAFEDSLFDCDEPRTRALVRFHHLVTLGSIRAYQGLISPARQAGCQMVPSCSRYAALALRNRGGLEALAATVDRLHRCGHDLQRYESLPTAQGTRAIDPPPGCVRRELRVSLGALAADTAAETPPAAGRAPEEQEALLRFADRLRERGYYPQAGLEYSRLLEYFPDSVHTARARRAIVECEYLAGRFTSAVEMGTRLLAEETGVEPGGRLRLLVAKAHLRSGQPEAGERELLALRSQAEAAPEVAGEADLLLGVASARRHRWVEARERFAAASSASPARRADALRICDEALRFRARSPTLAGALAVVPGAGYLYAGHRRAGLSALVVNGLFFWATAEAFDEGHRGLGTALVLFSSGWYVGNIYGSVATVQRQNVQTRADQVRRLELGLRIF